MPRHYSRSVVALHHIRLPNTLYVICPLRTPIQFQARYRVVPWIEKNVENYFSAISSHPHTCTCHMRLRAAYTFVTTGDVPVFTRTPLSHSFSSLRCQIDRSDVSALIERTPIKYFRYNAAAPVRRDHSHIICKLCNQPTKKSVLFLPRFYHPRTSKSAFRNYQGRLPNTTRIPYSAL